MTDRRYSEAEVAAIFERATEAHVPSQRQLPSTEGMTLAQLQDIGREVGIAPELLAQAAQTMALEDRATSRTFMGLPIGVGLSVDLGRKLTDDEWDRVVVDLRETFDAKGKQSRDGSFRQWTNGNLQALLEPSGTGHRIRLRTVRGDARGMIIGGLIMFGFAASTATLALMRGVDDRGLIMAIGTLAAMGIGMFGSGAFPLPAWARLRRRQMEEVAARVAVVASLPHARDDATT
jgi:hypothetical protein